MVAVSWLLGALLVAAPISAAEGQEAVWQTLRSPGAVLAGLAPDGGHTVAGRLHVE